MARTRILATLGPATSTDAQVRALVGAGADAVRINCSHGDDEQHRSLLAAVERVANEVDRHVTTVADLQGPKHRLGALESDPRTLALGEKLELVEGPGPSPSPEVAVNVPGILRALRPGSTVLVGDAAVELRIISVEASRAIAEAPRGGTIASHHGIYFPGTPLPETSLAPKDLHDLEVMVREGVDWIALSFVTTAQDLRRARDRIHDLHPDQLPRLLAKIERAEAIRHQVPIVEAADGIMVARGDLGIELPLQDLPVVQKELIFAARRAAKPCVVATQMLLSMVHASRPTRAEVSDAANAVLDGADCLMLSEETAIGEHPVEAVRYLREIAEATEPSLWTGNEFPLLGREGDLSGNELHGDEGAVAEAAVRLAARIGARAIVVPTHSGQTARLVARLRPKPPLLVLTSQPSTFGLTGLLWGARTRSVPARLALDALRERARTAVIEEFHLSRGDKVVLTAGYPVEGRPTNLLNVVEV